MKRGVSALTLGLLAHSLAAQQPKPAGLAATPCCAITAIDQKTGVVGARESSTGYRFSFEVKDPKLRAGLKVGQKIWADFTTKRVSLKPGAPCCDIIVGLSPP
jgi:hypothetical protein